MERKKYIPIILLIIFANFYLPKSDSQIIYDSYVKGDMKLWKKQIDKMNKQADKKKKIKNLIEYQYGYIAYCVGTDKDDEAEKYLKLAYDNLDLYEKNNGDKSIINSYKSAFIGFKISIDTYKAPFLGQKALDFGEKSMEKGDKIPIVLMNYANMIFYMPKFYGGDKEKAIKYMHRAKSIIEKDIKLTKNNWLYLNVILTIAQSYEKIEDYKKAEYYYNYALLKEPNFKYVKDELLPNLKTKQK